MPITACGTKEERAKEEQTNNDTKMELKNVNERVNMGAKLYVTPQPALMTATHDGEGNADAMTAARGGQQEGNRAGFQPSGQKTTENLRLNKAFTLSFADARTVAESDGEQWHGRRPECVSALIREFVCSSRSQAMSPMEPGRIR